MLHQGGAQHTRQRTLISSGFTPSRIRGLDDKVRDLCIELIGSIRPNGKCEMVADLARPLPLRLIGDMLGHSREDHAKIGSWTDSMIKGGCGPQHVDDEVNDAFGNFAEYHYGAVENRKANPGDDILTT